MVAFKDLLAVLFLSAQATAHVGSHTARDVGQHDSLTAEQKLNLLHLRRTLGIARRAAEDHAAVVEVPETDLRMVLGHIIALEEEVSKFLSNEGAVPPSLPPPTSGATPVSAPGSCTVEEIESGLNSRCFIPPSDDTVTPTPKGEALPDGFKPDSESKLAHLSANDDEGIRNKNKGDPGPGEPADFTERLQNNQGSQDVAAAQQQQDAQLKEETQVEIVTTVDDSNGLTTRITRTMTMTKTVTMPAVHVPTPVRHPMFWRPQAPFPPSNLTHKAFHPPKNFTTSRHRIAAAQQKFVDTTTLLSETALITPVQMKQVQALQMTTTPTSSLIMTPPIPSPMPVSSAEEHLKFLKLVSMSNSTAKATSSGFRTLKIRN